MSREIDLHALMAPISDEEPAGEDLRYTDVYEQIKESRRFDDPLEQGEWKTELKTADWDKAATLAVTALSTKTKDLQIAAWLTEALVMTEGYAGLAKGLRVMSGLLEGFWDSLYPQIDEGDLEYRVAPFEFLNEKLWSAVKQVPVTDSGRSNAFSWLKWQESREVGYESDTRNKYGDTDEGKKQRRDEQINEGKLTAEEFDSAVAATSTGFYASLNKSLTECTESFSRLDTLVDEKFGRDAPRLAELGKSIDDCAVLVRRMLKEKGGDTSPEPRAREVQVPEESVSAREVEATEMKAEAPLAADGFHDIAQRPPAPQGVVAPSPSAGARSALSDASPWEIALWEEARRTMASSGIKKALEQLLEAALVAPSVREKNRCKLLVGKLCLSAERPDLARPILDQLYGVVEQLQLEQWESPVWIADVIGSLYQCLTAGEPTDDDFGRAQVLFQKLCTIDITKAAALRKP